MRSWDSIYVERPDKRLKLINLPDFDCLNDLNNRICEKASIFSLCCGGVLDDISTMVLWGKY